MDKLVLNILADFLVQSMTVDFTLDVNAVQNSMDDHEKIKRARSAEIKSMGCSLLQ